MRAPARLMEPSSEGVSISTRGAGACCAPAWEKTASVPAAGDEPAVEGVAGPLSVVPESSCASCICSSWASRCASSRGPMKKNCQAMTIRTVRPIAIIELRLFSIFSSWCGGVAAPSDSRRGCNPRFQRVGKSRKGCIKHFAAAHDDIIATGLHCKRCLQAYSLFETAADAIALHGIALAFGHGKTDARPCLGFASVKNFQQKQGALASLALLNGEKLRTGLQSSDRNLCLFPGRGHKGETPLSRQTLATASATCGQNLAATVGCHARAEAVAALANEFGRLIGTLGRHLF